MMIYVTGDLHGNIDISKLNTKKFSDQWRLTKDDYVIICGDFGCIWDGSKTDEYWLKWLDNKNFTTLFVDGNHENFDLLEKYPNIQMFGSEVGNIGNSIYHLKRGNIYKIDSKTIFAFGGAKSHDIPYRTENISWWEREMPSLEEMENGLENLKKINFDIDIILTHTCPKSYLNYVVKGNTQSTILEEYFERLNNILEYHEIDYKWYFGHFHKDISLGERFRCLYNSIVKL